MIAVARRGISNLIVIAWLTRARRAVRYDQDMDLSDAGVYDFMAAAPPEHGRSERHRRSSPQMGEPRFDDVVQHHSCNAMSGGGSYYASSFCYWFPGYRSDGANATVDDAVVFEVPGQEARSLDCWKRAAFGFSLPEGGACVKCEYCHDNYRKDMMSGRLKIVPNPPGCKTDKEIKEQCNREYDHQESMKRSREEMDACAKTRQQFQKLAELVEAAKSGGSRLQALLRKSGQQQESKKRLMRQETSDKEADDRAKGTLRDAKLEFERKWGNVPYFCHRPKKPEEFVQYYDSNYNTMTPVANHNYEKEKDAERMYEACEKVKSLEQQQERTSFTLRQIQHRVQQLDDAIAELAREQTQLQQLMQQAKDPQLEDKFTKAQTAWHGMKADCERLISSYYKGRNDFMVACKDRLYSSSCEASCIEAQREERGGCGILEGANPKTYPVPIGAITLNYAPPNPSWLKGASEEREGQIARIAQAMRPIYTQSVLKSGWVWRVTSTMSYTKKTFLVLESGTEVRSPVLRCFRKIERGKVDEATERSVTMWHVDKLKGFTLRLLPCVDIQQKGKEKMQFCFERGDKGKAERDGWLADLQAQAPAAQGV